MPSRCYVGTFAPSPRSAQLECLVPCGTGTHRQKRGGSFFFFFRGPSKVASVVFFWLAFKATNKGYPQKRHISVGPVMHVDVRVAWEALVSNCDLDSNCLACRQAKQPCLQLLARYPFSVAEYSRAHRLSPFAAAQAQKPNLSHRMSKCERVNKHCVPIGLSSMHPKVSASMLEIPALGLK